MAYASRRTRTIDESKWSDQYDSPVEYLTQIIEDEVNLYAQSFRKTERKKIRDILAYYGLELGTDVTYTLEWDSFWEGNKTLEFTWWAFDCYGSVMSSICY